MKYLYLLLVGGLVGCASVKVETKMSDIDKNYTKSKIVYIKPFDIYQGDWKIDKVGTDGRQFQEKLQKDFVGILYKELSKNYEVRLFPSNFVPKSGWVIGGEFSKVYQGSRAARMLVGLGAGATKLETIVYLYDLTKSDYPFARFNTTGGSNGQPGWLCAGLVGAGFNASGLNLDMSRTAREINKFIQTL